MKPLLDALNDPTHPSKGSQSTCSATSRTGTRPRPLRVRDGRRGHGAAGAGDGRLRRAARSPPSCPAIARSSPRKRSAVGQRRGRRALGGRTDGGQARPPALARDREARDSGDARARRARARRVARPGERTRWRSSRVRAGQGTAARAAAAYVLGEIGGEGDRAHAPLDRRRARRALPADGARRAHADTPGAEKAEDRATEERATVDALADALFEGGDAESPRDLAAAEAIRRAGAGALMALANRAKDAAPPDPFAPLDDAVNVAALLEKLVPEGFAPAERADTLVRFEGAIQRAARSALTTSTQSRPVRRGCDGGRGRRLRALRRRQERHGGGRLGARSAARRNLARARAEPGRVLEQAWRHRPARAIVEPRRDRRGRPGAVGSRRVDPAHRPLRARRARGPRRRRRGREHPRHPRAGRCASSRRKRWGAWGRPERATSRTRPSAKRRRATHMPSSAKPPSSPSPRSIPTAPVLLRVRWRERMLSPASAKPRSGSHRAMTVSFARLAALSSLASLFAFVALGCQDVTRFSNSGDYLRRRRDRRLVHHRGPRPARRAVL